MGQVSKTGLGGEPTINIHTHIINYSGFGNNFRTVLGYSPLECSGSNITCCHSIPLFNWVVRRSSDMGPTQCSRIVVDPRKGYPWLVFARQTAYGNAS